MELSTQLQAPLSSNLTTFTIISYLYPLKGLYHQPEVSQDMCDRPIADPTFPITSFEVT
jgi:hypothetical protein